MFIVNPKKSNLANQKLTEVILSNGEVVQTYIKGEGRTLLRSMVLHGKRQKGSGFVWRQVCGLSPGEAVAVCLSQQSSQRLLPSRTHGRGRINER